MAALVGPHVGQLGPASKRCSVVILSYNSMKTIERCLNSVLPTLGSEDELILVNNASQDGTQDYLTNFASQANAVTAQCENSDAACTSVDLQLTTYDLRPKVKVTLNQGTKASPKAATLGCWLPRASTSFS